MGLKLTATLTGVQVRPLSVERLHPVSMLACMVVPAVVADVENGDQIPVPGAHDARNAEFPGGLSFQGASINRIVRLGDGIAYPLPGRHSIGNISRLPVHGDGGDSGAHLVVHAGGVLELDADPEVVLPSVRENPRSDWGMS